MEEEYPALTWRCPWCDLNFHIYYIDKSVVNEARKNMGEHISYHLKSCNKWQPQIPISKLTSV